MRSKVSLVIGLIVIILFTGFISQDSDKYFKIAKSIDIFGRIFKEINVNYVDEVNPEEFMLAGIKGMLNSLDPYTVYLDQNLQKDMDIITNGKYGGIGATVGIQNGRVTIVDLLEGYSAQRQGIRIGDIISSVDENEINLDNYDDLGQYLKREPGTEVLVKIERDGVKDVMEFLLVCEQIELKNITYYGFVPAESSNGYIKLSGFSRTAGQEIKNAIIDLKSQKQLSSLILDLRGNPGGLLDAAIDISEKFLKNKQLVVSVKGRDKDKEVKYYSKEEPLANDIPLVVLINGGSASASEIVAGAIQDHDRGIIIGTNSFGKGLVQTVVPLSYNTSLKITTARYFTPSGRSIQKINYSDKNDVFENNGSFSVDEFETDNHRKVYSAGGIKPDTIIQSSSESKLVKKLLAKGMFFKFATNYYNTNPDLVYKDLDDRKLLDAFYLYLDKQEYKINTKAEELLNELNKTVESDNHSETFKKMVKELCVSYEKMKSDELNRYESDLVSEVRKELAARFGGREGRIHESLKFDKQFDLAYQIVQSEKDYKQLLNVGN